MQRTLAAAEPTEPMIKPQASPTKMSSSGATTSQTKEIPPTQKAEELIEDRLGNQKASLLSKEDSMLHAENTAGLITVTTKDETTGSPLTTVVPSVTKGTTAVTFDKTPPLAQPAVVDKDMKRSQRSSDAQDIDKKEKGVIVPKLADQPETMVDQVNPKQTSNKESNLFDSSKPESTLLATQIRNQESAGFLSSSNPKPSHAPSKTAETVTGKMLGFGSSLFGSASTLITSAVQESRTTPPNSCKMSAPAQVSDKMSASEIPPKTQASVSPKTAVRKEVKPPTAQKPVTEKKEDKPLQAQVTNIAQTKGDRGLSEPGRPDFAPEGRTSTCPLCKADLNLGSKEPANYKTCTECKTLVCSKCGFSPMPSLKEVRKSLSA